MGAVAFAALAVAIVTYTGVVGGESQHPIGEPFTDARGTAILHWRNHVNQGVAPCAAPKIRAELGDQAFASEGSAPLGRGTPRTRFEEIVSACGHPGEVGDKFWALVIGVGAVTIAAITRLCLASQPRLRTAAHRDDGVRGRQTERPRAGGFEPGVIRGPLSGWR